MWAKNNELHLKDDTWMGRSCHCITIRMCSKDLYVTNLPAVLVKTLDCPQVGRVWTLVQKRFVKCHG